MNSLGLSTGKSLWTRSLFRLTMAVALVAALGSAHGDENESLIPERLEEAIDLALTHSPAIAKAQAELQRAAAELQQAKMEVVREVSRSHVLVHNLRLSIQALSQENINGTMHAVPDEENPLQRKLVGEETQLLYLLGLAGGPTVLERDAGTPDAGPAASLPVERWVPAQRPSVSESAEKDLAKIWSPDFRDIPLDAFVEALADEYGLNILVDSAQPVAKAVVMRINLHDVPLLQILEATTDLLPDLCVVCRDYGFLFVTRTHALTINAPTIPEDIPLYLPAPSYASETGPAEGTGLGVPPKRPSLPEKAEKALVPIVSVEFEDIALGDLLMALADSYDLNINVDSTGPLAKATIDHINLKEVTIAQVFQTVTDLLPEVCVVCRDYSFIFVPRERALTINAATIPEDIPLHLPAPSYVGAAGPAAAPGPLGTAAPPVAVSHRPAVPEAVEKQLSAEVSVDIEDLSLADFTGKFGDSYDLDFVLDPEIDSKRTFNLRVEGTIGEVFLSLTDLFPDLCFVIRDYGFLLTTRERAGHLDGATIPEDVPLHAAPGGLQWL